MKRHDRWLAIGIIAFAAGGGGLLYLLVTAIVDVVLKR